MTTSITRSWHPARGGYVSDDPTGDALLILRGQKADGVTLTKAHVDAAARMTGADPFALWSLILSSIPRKY